MTYSWKNKKYFDYEKEGEVHNIWMKLFEWGRKMVIQSEYYIFNFKLPTQKKSVSDISFEMDKDKILLGVGIELMLKALVLKNGFVLHEINNNECVKKINDLEENDTINYNKMISFEYIKNQLNNFKIITNRRTKSTLERIQEWRNGIIHQAQGPTLEHSRQQQDIIDTFNLINNQLEEN